MTTPTQSIAPAAATLSSMSEADLIWSIKSAYESTQRAHKEAVSNSIVTGLLLSHAKETIVHGNFKTWIKDSLPGLSYDTANRYRKLANAIRDQFQKLHSATFEEQHLYDLAQLDDGAQLDILEQIQELIGERSLTELYFDFDIVRKADPKGGKRIGKPGGLSPEEENQAIQAEWTMFFDKIYTAKEDASWTHLPKAQIEGIVGTLEPLLEEMKAALS